MHPLATVSHVPQTSSRAAAVLFDMDGTLVDSTAVVETIWGEFARRFDLDVDELLAFSHGRQSLDTVRHFLPSDHDPVAVTHEQESRELVLLDGITEVPGAARLLESLLGAPVAVVTSAPRELALARMEAAGLHVPAVLVAAEDVQRGKPAPEGYLRAAGLLGVDPADCTVFEDAPAGIESGVASGAHTVVVGGLESPVATGLERVADLTGVSASYDEESKRVHLRW